MKCPECGKLAGSHDDGCKWAATVGDRFFRTHNLLMGYLGTRDVQKLRDAQDALSELIAWAAAEEIERKGIRQSHL